MFAQMGAPHREHRGASRKTRFSRRKTISRWPSILPRLRALSLHASTIAARILIVSTLTTVIGEIRWFAISSPFDPISPKT